MTTRSLNNGQRTKVDWMRPWRYLWRVPFLLVHLLIGLPLTLLVCTTLGRRYYFRGQSLREGMIRWWSRNTCRIFGLKIRVYGQAVAGPALWVANHSSWLDIELLHAQRAVSFVAKAEIARWPVVGTLARIGASVFHHRGSSHSQQRVIDALAQTLKQGQSVAIFPEGRTGRGDYVLPFHGRLLQAAVATGVPVQPVAIGFRPNSAQPVRIPFAEGESFMGNFLRLLGGPSTIAELHFLTPIHPNGQGRKQMAGQARDDIVAALER